MYIPTEYIQNIYQQNLKNTFKLKVKYVLSLLTPEKMKLLRSSEENVNTDKHRKNISDSEITEVILLVHCNIATNNY